MLNRDIELKLTWWEKFYKENKDNNDFKEIFEYIEVVDEKTTEESVKKLKKMVEALDKEKYKKEVEKFERKIRIFEKRLERKISENFGAILRHYREEKGLSLAELGERAGISASYINRIELGERNAPSYPIIEKLAEGLDINPVLLMDAAGIINKETDRAKTVTELLFSNNVALKEGEPPINVNTKKQLAEIIEYIIDMEWKDNKHIEMVKLIELLDEFK